MTKKFFEDSKSFKEDKFFKDEKLQDKKDEKDKSLLTDEALEGVAGGAPRTPPAPNPDPKTQPGVRR